MAKSQIPVVGEPFRDYVNGQITARQKIHGSGFNQTRTPEQMAYLNSNVPWIKMASSVNISEKSGGFERLKKLGLKPDSNGGDILAKQGVLFNGLTPLGGSMKSGVAQSKSLINSSAYGFGGTEFGLKPLPGIISIDVTPVNRGSIKQANVNIKAYNKFQFELIETLYLRLGFTIMLEWGNSLYIDNGNKVQKMGNTLIENFFFEGRGSHLDVLSRIEKERKDKFGNYDALFARVVNFDWTYQPDGSYDITLKLVSLGDVVESFKTNVLTPSTVIDEKKLSKTSRSEGDDLTDDNVNKNSISNYLYLIKSQFTEDQFRDKNNGVLKIADSFSKDHYFASASSIEQRLYIRLGTLLEYIQKEILTHFSNGNGADCFPLVYINTSPDCVMKSKPKLISVEPQNCIILPNFSKMGITTPEWGNYMNTFFVNESGSLGYINDVYLNFNYIEKLLKSDTDKEGGISLYSFITAILGGINRSLSNVCNLELTVNEDQNQIIIRDQNLIPRLTKNGMLKEEEKSTIIEVTGFKGVGKDENVTYFSNFVKNFSFKTQITSKLSSMLSIGATANNNSVNEDATAFSKWNFGLIDRFQQTITDGTPDGCKVMDCTEEEDLKGNKKTVSKDKFPPWLHLYVDVVTASALFAIKFSSWNKDRQKEQERLNTLVTNYNTTLQNYLNAAFAETYEIGEYVTIDLDTGKEKIKTMEWNGKKYFQNDPDFIEKGKSILKNYITSDDLKHSSNSDLPSSNIGFIPIELSLDIIGMSGMKIYNQLRLNTDFLPYNYPKVMEFVVMGLSHKVDSSGWSTSINAIAKPKSKPPLNNVQAMSGR